MSGASTADPWIALVGVGNPAQGDDGIGPAVVAALADRLPSAVVAWTTRSALDLATDLEGYTVAILVDAAVGGGPPGTVHRLAFGHDTIPADGGVLSSHETGLLVALALADRLGTLPKTPLILAVEAADFTAGTPAARHLVTIGSRAVLDLLAALMPAATRSNCVRTDSSERR